VRTESVWSDSESRRQDDAPPPETEISRVCAVDDDEHVRVDALVVEEPGVAALA
jgi:hypothetical protein